MKQTDTTFIAERIPLSVSHNGQICRGEAISLAHSETDEPACKYEVVIQAAGIKACLYHDADNHWKLKGVPNTLISEQIIQQINNWYKKSA